MRTKLWTLILAVAVLGCVLGGILVSLRPTSTSAAASSAETTHLHFLVKFIGQDTFLDLGAPGPSQGCVFFDLARPQENCTVTFSLPGGDIMTQFLNSPPPAKTLAITGGTGIYRDVRGQGKLVESGHGTATLSFDLIES